MYNIRFFPSKILYSKYLKVVIIWKNILLQYGCQIEAHFDANNQLYHENKHSYASALVSYASLYSVRTATESNYFYVLSQKLYFSNTSAKVFSPVSLTVQ